MKTPPVTKPPNGKGKTLACPSGIDCEVAQSAADTLSLIDARFTRVEERLSLLHEEALGFRRAVLESHDEVLRALRRMEGRDA